MALPDDYGSDRFVALVRDPSTVFAYWNISKKLRMDLALRVGKVTLAKSEWVMRFTNLGTGAVSDTIIDPDACNWYVSVLSDCAYESELGVLLPSGRYQRVIAGNRVEVPPSTYSHLYDKQWMILKEDYLRLLALGWAGFIGSSFTVADDSGNEATWVTVLHEGEKDGAGPTSPGVPAYKGRK
ncbi:MAG: DUF4912 domain-containing protein [Planctomycetes bacterium]|nr:DUF4912 domain-containing protein [Planctomycetota bacterium]